LVVLAMVVPIFGQHAASIADGGIEIVDGIEVFVGQRLVDERPQMFGGLQFGAVGRLIDRPNTVRKGQILRAMPARIVKLQHGSAREPGAGGAGEGFEQFGKERLVDPVRQIPDGLRGDEGGDVEPFVAVVTERERTLADRRPDPAMDRLQADPMFVYRPDFDRLVGMFVGFVRGRLGQFFLKAAASSALADFGFFGRGDWIE
jgi:hypothetical protein